jgi:hypothetical protein
MSSRIASLLFLVTLSSCGLFGSKDDPDRQLDFPQSYGGCFNEAGVRFENYLKGEIVAQEWGKAWDCTMDSLRLLNKFAGTSTGWKHSDLKSLVETLVITDSDLPDTFMPAAFELKASLVGGSKDKLTAEELNKIIEVFRVIKEESSAFIPHLVKRKKEPTPANMLALSRDLSKMITQVGAQFSPRDSAPLTKKAIGTLITDLTKILKWENREWLVDAMMAGKALLTGGDPELIEANSWARVFETLGSVGAPMLAIASVDKERATGPNEYGEFLGVLANDVISALEGSADAHGGVIPASDLDRMIDSLPADMLPVTKSTTKSVTRAATGRILGAAQAGGLDKPSLQRALGYFNVWKKGRTHIEKLFANHRLSKSGVSKAEMLSAIASYRASVGSADRADVDRIASLVENYRPMFVQGEDVMVIGGESRYSFDQLVKLNWMNLAGEVAVEKYSSAADRSALSFADFQGLYADAYEIGIELKAIDPTVPDFDGRRFREADYYMPISDGSESVSEHEATYYIAYLVSAGGLYRVLRENVEEQCKISDQLGPMDWKWMNAQCVRNHWWAHSDFYLGTTPQMLDHYRRQNLVMKSQLEHDFEMVARLRGYSGDPFGGYDIKAFASALQYVETIFQRYDTDGSQVWTTQEAIAASAIFGTAIARTAEIDPSETDKIQAIFTFILKNGRKPADGLGGMIEVGAWMLVRPFWDLRVDRNGVYKAFGVFVASPS